MSVLYSFGISLSENIIKQILTLSRLAEFTIKHYVTLMVTLTNKKHYDVLILGAGGAGLMCAAEAGKRGRSVLALDHARIVGKKILISGGGRCNFTNLNIEPERFLSGNKHFCKSAFSQYTQFDFIALVKKHGIKFHEKKLGQQFCDDAAQQIVDMLLKECADASAQVQMNTTIEKVRKPNSGFEVQTSEGTYTAESLVVATGGLSIPKIGATSLGYDIAKQFDIPLTDTTPALVPFTFNNRDAEMFEGLSGIAFDAEVRCGKTSFRENVLLTHRGLSGPAILQISSYWQPGEEIEIRLLPDVDWQAYLKQKRHETPKQTLQTALAEKLPKRFVQRLAVQNAVPNKVMAETADKEIHALNEMFEKFTFKPGGTEGYRKAEVTLGGVSTKALDARTLEAKNTLGLFFIGEVVDVTGWLGGYNFQWAWSSGFAAGQVV